MSAPTPAPGDDRPREGYYPDPSIPGYVRYWNGAGWVPGTSRPAPAAGETLPRPPGVSPAPPSVAETGPVFFDEEPPPQSAIPHQGSGAAEHPGIPQQPGPDQPGRADQGAAAAAPYSGIPEQSGPAGGQGAAEHSGWDESGADARRAPVAHDEPVWQDESAWQEERNLPGDAAGADPGTGRGPEAAGGTGEFGQDAGFERGGRFESDALGSQPAQSRPPEHGERGRHSGRPEPAWGADASRQSGFGGEQDRRVSWGAPQAVDPRVAQWPDAAEPAEPAAQADGTLPMRAAEGGIVSRGSQGTSGAAPSEEQASSAAGRAEQTSEGTVTFRRPGVAPETSGDPSEAPPRRPDADAGGTVAIRAVRPGGGPGSPQAPQFPATPGGPASQVPPQSNQFGGPQGPQTAGAAPQTMPYFPHQPGGQAAGQAAPSWRQDDQQPVPPAPGGPAPDLGEPVVPWKPPVSDPFLAVAQAQAASRPASLGKRLAARLVDTVVVGAVTAVAAVPLGSKAVDHINDKIDAAKLSGETVTVWLLDGTTGASLGIVLAVLLVFGALYEALPTAKWGQTLGKKLCGIQVRDIEGHEPPGFGAALRRWLVYCVPGLLVIGVLGVLWCLFDRPWRQCWHDKAAHTFVAS